jgi:pyruvate,water dikinase
VTLTYVIGLTAAADVAAVGGKAASLGELSRAGVQVPGGFAVTVAGFAAAMTALDPDGARRAEVEALPSAGLAAIAAVGSRFREHISGAPLPADVAAAITAAYARLGDEAPDVAVRSSATVEDSADASFAGLQDTYLGISGIDSVLTHVRRCWASLYNDESVAYRRRLRLPEAEVSMAVVVQRMVRPRAAGVMFTRSPVTGDRSVVAIEATWGLGSALVSGDVTPDSFVISKITGEITGRRVSAKDKTHVYQPHAGQAAPSGAPGAPDSDASDSDARGGTATGGTVDAHRHGTVEGPAVTVADTPPELREAPCLNDGEIRALAAIARRVEAHYGVPQDIEWAVLDGDDPEDARIVLLQSRPETVWAARGEAPAGAPKARAADHVLALFGKPL